MLSDKKYAVYYRELPAILVNFLNTDSSIKYAKDGIKNKIGHKCPRLSVIIHPCGNADQDKSRVKKFESLLNELAANNQIVGYTT